MTHNHPQQILKTPSQEDEEDVSYDVKSLFTNISINEATDYILDQIYNQTKNWNQFALNLSSSLYY